MTEIDFELDGRPVRVPADGHLLQALRERLGVRSVKDGCSPQGQCGCCTVLVDGAPRVACVTPVRRVRGRAVTTLDGLDAEVLDRWATALGATGGSQCGFCTPGIIVRLEGQRSRRGLGDRAIVDRALAAHLCRCTGWQTVVEAALSVDEPAASGDRDLAAASRRATIEGRSPQVVDPSIPLGRAPFADDTAPAGALVAVPDARGDWLVAETLDEALHAAGKVQGRRTTLPVTWPLEVPPGDWAATLRTTWVEPAYLEPDASWCAPGGEPSTPLANGGAFGGKEAAIVGETARRLADRHGRAVRAVLPREWVVRWGPKRPPVAAGIRPDGSGSMRVVATPGIAEAIAAVAPELEVEEIVVPGPPTSSALRAAGWAEAALLRHALTADGPTTVEAPDGGVAEAVVDDDVIRVAVAAGEVLDEIALRSYVIGAAHQALGWVTSEALRVDDAGEPQDLTIRSFGVVRAGDTPRIEVVVDHDDDRPPVNGSDAAFVAVAAALWRARGCPPSIPVEEHTP